MRADDEHGASLVRRAHGQCNVQEAPLVLCARVATDDGAPFAPDRHHRVVVLLHRVGKVPARVAERADTDQPGRRCGLGATVEGAAAKLLGGGGEHSHRYRHRLVGIVRLTRSLGQLVEQCHPSRRHDLVGGHRQHREHAPGARTVGHVAVGEREVGLLRSCAALDRQRQILGPGGGSAGQHRPLHRTDLVPDLGELDRQKSAQGVGVLGTEGRDEGVVVEHHELVAPGQDHRVAAPEQGRDRRTQALGPGLAGAEGGSGPVVVRHPAGHLALPGEERVLVVHAVNIDAAGRSGTGCAGRRSAPLPLLREVARPERVEETLREPWRPPGAGRPRRP